VQFVLGLSRRRPAPPRAPVDPPPGEVAAILLLAQEGLYFQDEVEDVLVEIRDGGDLGELSRRGGPIISRYERMRRDLRSHTSPALLAYRDALDEVFANHALLLHSALDLLAVSWRSERLEAEQRRLGRVGPQGARLQRIVGELKALTSR
jgi:hypothetical protein